jgi:hypothetical protein
MVDLREETKLQIPFALIEEYRVNLTGRKACRACHPGGLQKSINPVFLPFPSS